MLAIDTDMKMASIVGSLLEHIRNNGRLYECDAFPTNT